MLACMSAHALGCLLSQGSCRTWTPAAKGGGEDGQPGLPEALEAVDDAFSVAPTAKPGAPASSLWARLLQSQVLSVTCA